MNKTRWVTCENVTNVLQACVLILYKNFPYYLTLSKIKHFEQSVTHYAQLIEYSMSSNYQYNCYTIHEKQEFLGKKRKESEIQ